MPYRNKVFVSFDGDSDIHYYRLMRAWKQNDYTLFNFYDAHDLNYARDTSLEESIKAQLSERLRNSSVFVLLIGEKTRYLFKFVRWEIEQALSRKLPIIGVNLNGYKQQDGDRCPPIIRDELAIHISFNAAILQYALEHWPASDALFRSQGKTGPYHYQESVYRQLGLYIVATNLLRPGIDGLAGISNAAVGGTDVPVSTDDRRGCGPTVPRGAP